MVHTSINEKGGHNVHVHDTESMAHEHMSHYDHKTMKAAAEGTMMHISAKHKKTGETRRVASINLKAQNSPCSGLVSTFKLHPHDKPIQHDEKTGATVKGGKKSK